MHLLMHILRFLKHNQSERKDPIAFIIHEFGNENEIIKVWIKHKMRKIYFFHQTPKRNKIYFKSNYL